jgi:hypothetical protein
LNSLLKANAPRSVRSFTLLVLPLVTGLLVLFLAMPARSIILLFLWCLLFVTVAFTVEGRDLRINVKIPWNLRQVVYWLLTLATLTLFLLVMAKAGAPVVRAPLYLVVAMLAPGISLLQIIGYRTYRSLVEVISLSYVISAALVMIVGASVISAPSYLRNLVLLAIIFLLCLLSLISNRKRINGPRSNKYELTFTNDSLIVILLLLFFGFFFIELYPSIGYLLGLDVSRVYLMALAYSKDLPGGLYYLSSLYPLFNVYESFIITIVGRSADIFHITSIVLNIFVILTFYVMANVYLRRFSSYAPSIATAMWALFSGFGWLSYVMKRIEIPNASTSYLISQVDAFSYGDITWRRLFFHLPMELSLAMLFVLLYLIGRNDLPRVKVISIMLILLIPLPLVHPGFIPLLFLMLFCFALLAAREMRSSLYSIGYSLVLGALGSLLVSFVLISNLGIGLDYLPVLELLSLGLFVLALMHFRRKVNFLSKTGVLFLSEINKVRHGVAKSILMFSVLSVYFGALLLWVSGKVSFSFVDLVRFGYAPWFFYPERFGILGILYLLSVFLILTDKTRQSRELLAIAAAVPTIVIVARLISMVKMHYVSEFVFYINSFFQTSLSGMLSSYVEDRMLELVRIPLALVASLILCRGVLDRIKINGRTFRCLLVFSLVALVFATGVGSVLLGFEFYHGETQTGQPSPQELGMIDHLRDDVYVNGRAVIIGSPKFTPGELEYTGARSIVTEAPEAWASRGPEFPLFVTRESITTPTYLFLNKTGDFQDIGDYGERYLEHLSNVAGTYLKDGELEMKVINNWSVPTSHSSTALVIPYNVSKGISHPRASYQPYKQLVVVGLFFEKEKESLNSNNGPLNYSNMKLDEAAVFNGANSSIRVGSNTSRFDELLIEFNFQPLDLIHNQVVISKFDWGKPGQKSWEVAQYGRHLVFKVSPDGEREEVLQTEEVLDPNLPYVVRAEYNGAFMKIFVDNLLVATKSYRGGIVSTKSDIVIGAELRNGVAASFAKMKLWDLQVLNAIPSTDAPKEPIFCAYDLLSSAGFNYTTVLSNDNGIKDYEVLVLPYDDSITYPILDQIGIDQTARTRFIIILNTNGYGPFLALSAKKTQETFDAMGVTATKYSAIQPSVKVPSIDPADSQVRAWYVGNSHSSPLIMTAKRDRVELVYVNIQPLISANQLLNQAPLQCIKEVLSDYVRPFDSSTKSPWFSGKASLLFAESKATGVIQFVSSSVPSIKLSAGDVITIQQNNSYKSLTGLDSISIGQGGLIQITSKEVAFKEGYGFYTTVVARDPSILLKDQAVYLNGKDKVAGGPLSINVVGNVTLLMRQPEVSVNGVIWLKDFHFMHEGPPIYADGRDMTISGEITLHIYLSDDATIAFPYAINSPILVKYDPPRMEFDEVKSLQMIIPYTLLVAALLATMFILVRYSGMRAKAHENQLQIEHARSSPADSS